MAATTKACRMQRDLVVRAQQGDVDAFSALHLPERSVCSATCAVEAMPAWTSNRLKRLVPSPKRNVVDPGLPLRCWASTSASSCATATSSGGSSTRSSSPSSALSSRSSRRDRASSTFVSSKAGLKWTSLLNWPVVG